MAAGAADDNADGEVSRSNRVLEVRYVPGILKNEWRCVLPAGMGAGDSKLWGSSCGYSDRGGGP